jgi:hypothetical protein
MFSVKSMCLAVELHLFHYCDLCPMGLSCVSIYFMAFYNSRARVRSASMNSLDVRKLLLCILQYVITYCRRSSTITTPPQKSADEKQALYFQFCRRTPSSPTFSNIIPFYHTVPIRKTTGVAFLDNQ